MGSEKCWLLLRARDSNRGVRCYSRIVFHSEVGELKGRLKGRARETATSCAAVAGASPAAEAGEDKGFWTPLARAREPLRPEAI
jgi:hypothetical protein